MEWMFEEYKVMQALNKSVVHRVLVKVKEV